MFRFGHEENLDSARVFAIVVEWTRDFDAEYCFPCPRLYWLPFGQLSGQLSLAENRWLSSGTRLRWGRAAEGSRLSECRIIQGKCRGPARTRRWPMVTEISSPETAERVNVQAPSDLVVRGDSFDRSQRRLAEASVCAAGLGVVHPRTAGVLPSIPCREEHLTLGTARRIDISRQYVTQSATATASALPRLLIVRPACAFGAASSSVARGARLTVASCFHTLVSAIRGGWPATRNGPRSQWHGLPKPGWRAGPTLVGSVREMLSIGKLGAGRSAAEYYLARPAGCPAEYYTGSGERRGVWLGRGAAALGLSGDIDEAVLRHLLAGRSPDGATLVEPVLRADPRGRVPAGPLVAHAGHGAAPARPGPWPRPGCARPAGGARPPRQSLLTTPVPRRRDQATSRGVHPTRCSTPPGSPPDGPGSTPPPRGRRRACRCSTPGAPT